MKKPGEDCLQNALESIDRTDLFFFLRPRTDPSRLTDPPAYVGGHWSIVQPMSLTMVSTVEAVISLHVSGKCYIITLTKNYNSTNANFCLFLIFIAVIPFPVSTQRWLAS
ncbi:hypothetical protein NPIL_199701 [Nephila pilipes]|uniref:Uncharacterized protein n=1 Tax=Nephila pilipes TaxID=299642 RepID=A0A8X6TNR8_NEPPI|nr:hypothetical protein NPIL_199701 [Nephila pilipes]